MSPPSRPISPSARKLSMKNRLFVESRDAKTNKENCPFWQQKISPLPHVYTDCLRGGVIKTQSVSSRRPTLFWWFYDVIFLRPSPAMVAWSAPWELGLMIRPKSHENNWTGLGKKFTWKTKKQNSMHNSAWILLTTSSGILRMSW